MCSDKGVIIHRTDWLVEFVLVFLDCDPLLGLWLEKSLNSKTSPSFCHDFSDYSFVIESYSSWQVVTVFRCNKLCVDVVKLLQIGMPHLFLQYHWVCLAWASLCSGNSTKLSSNRNGMWWLARRKWTVCPANTS